MAQSQTDSSSWADNHKPQRALPLAVDHGARGAAESLTSTGGPTGRGGLALGIDPTGIVLTVIIVGIIQ